MPGMQPGMPMQQPGMPGYGAPGMQPGMPGMQPQPGMPGYKPTTYTAQGLPMRWMNTNPYPGAVAVTCDLCQRDIAVAYWFHHCDASQTDYCQQCGKAYTR